MDEETTSSEHAVSFHRTKPKNHRPEPDVINRPHNVIGPTRKRPKAAQVLAFGIVAVTTPTGVAGCFVDDTFNSSIINGTSDCKTSSPLVKTRGCSNSAHIKYPFQHREERAGLQGGGMAGKPPPLDPPALRCDTSTRRGLAQFAQDVEMNRAVLINE